MLSLPNTSSLSVLLTRFRREKAATPPDEALHALILEAQQEIASNRRNLMFADSEALTDMYIYAIKASEIRYAHLLQLAKKAEAV